MAVIAPFREANELDVLTKARQLAEYIFTICKNEKQFPRRDRWMLTADILHEAAHVLAHVRRANAVRVTTAEDYTQRRSEQVAALSSLDALMGYADLAYTVLHLSGDRAEYWTGLMVEEMALKKCCRGVRWKPSTAGYEHYALANTYRLRQELLLGSYKLSSYQRFTIREPKVRDIVATRLRDRQFQRALCDAVLYPSITRRFIYDNGACQRGKGVDFALDRMTAHLQQYYREQKQAAEAATGHRLGRFCAGGWVLACDVRHFFDSTPHTVAKAAVAKRVYDSETVRHNARIIDSFGGERGIGLGSQVSQLNQLAVLDALDHRIKETHRIRHYLRYMDDLALIHSDREKLEQVLADIRTQMAALGLELNSKTRIYPLRQGVMWLQWRFVLTDRGKVVRKLNDKKIGQERRKLRKMHKRVEDGRMTMAQVRDHYRCWKANAQRGNTRNLLKQMDRTYTDIMKEEPP